MRSVAGALLSAALALWRPGARVGLQRSRDPVATAPNTDWRQVRAGLVSLEQRTKAAALPELSQQETYPPPPPAASEDWWVHELAVPERGCVLLAQPGALFPEQPLLHRAAVLVLEHCESEGTVGLLLDRPTKRTVAHLLDRRKEPPTSPVRLFAERPLWIGGNVLTRGKSLRVITRRCDVAGATEIIRGLYECTPRQASRLVAIGAAPADDFHFFAAACQWTPHKLRQELHAAAWLPVATSAAAVCPRTRDPLEGTPRRPAATERSHRGPSGRVRGGGEGGAGGSGSGGEGAGGSGGSGEGAGPWAVSEPADALYFSLIEGAGGEYARQARLTRSAAEVDVWLQHCATRAVDVWRSLAQRVVAEGLAGHAVAGGGALPIESVALQVHSAMHARDNLTDVMDGLDSLAEQAHYIWFTREIDAQLQPHTETPPRDPTELSYPPRHAHRPPGRRDAPDGSGDRELRHGRSPPTSSGAFARRQQRQRRGVGGGGGAPIGGGVPPLRVVSAASLEAASLENALLALNLLLFEASDATTRTQPHARNHTHATTRTRRNHTHATTRTRRTRASDAHARTRATHAHALPPRPRTRARPPRPR